MKHLSKLPPQTLRDMAQEARAYALQLEDQALLQERKIYLEQRVKKQRSERKAFINQLVQLASDNANYNTIYKHIVDHGLDPDAIMPTLQRKIKKKAIQNRNRIIMQRVALGWTNQEIADFTGLSTSRVKQIIRQQRTLVQKMEGPEKMARITARSRATSPLNDTEAQKTKEPPVRAFEANTGA